MLEVDDYENGADHQSELTAGWLMVLNDASLIVATARTNDDIRGGAGFPSRLATTSHVTVTGLVSLTVSLILNYITCVFLDPVTVAPSQLQVADQNCHLYSHFIRHGIIIIVKLSSMHSAQLGLDIRAHDLYALV